METYDLHSTLQCNSNVNLENFIELGQFFNFLFSELYQAITNINFYCFNQTSLSSNSQNNYEYITNLEYLGILLGKCIQENKPVDCTISPFFSECLFLSNEQVFNEKK